MSKITLNNVANLIDTTTSQNTINANSATIQAAFDNTLSLDGTSPNQMKAPIDMNSNQIVNLPAPATVGSPLRLQDLNTFVGGGTISSLPAGGTTGQTLSKTSNADYAVGWASTTLTAGTNINVVGSTVSTVANPTFTTVNTATIPTVVDTLVARNTIDTLSNKTIDTATGNVIKINGNAIVSSTGTGNVVFANSPTLVTPTLGAATATSLTTPTLINTGTLTLPISTDTLVGRATTDTLTNKTFDTAGAGNVFKINGLQISANTGTGSNVLATSPVLITPTLGAATATSLTFSPTTGGIIGTITNDNASAGSVGEYIQADVTSGSGISLTTGVAANVTSISLTAGDWDVSGIIYFSVTATTSISQILASLSLTTGALDTTDGRWSLLSFAPFVPGSAGQVLSQAIGPQRFSLAATTTLFLVTRSNFTVSTCTANGLLRARRIR